MNRRNFIQSTAVVSLGAVLPVGASWGLQPRMVKPKFSSSLTPLRGFAGQDVQCERAAIEGSIPDDLRGVFYRNGPGLFERGLGANEQRYSHWFDGDGLVNAWRITDKGVSHQARFVQTKKFMAEQAANDFLVPAFGSSIKAKIPVRSNDDVNTANTSVVRLGDRLLAMWEGGSATEMNPHTLATGGLVAWAPELKSMPFSAHPKIEADGTFWNFGTLMGKMVLYHISAQGKLIKHAVFDAPSGAMVHDFAITHKHLVFMLPPIGMDMAAFRNGAGIGEAMTWNPSAPTKVLVVDKNDFSQRRILEMPPFMVFHFGNAWEKDNVIHVDFVRSKDMSIMNEQMPKIMRGEMVTPDPSNPAFVTIDLNRNRCDIKVRDEVCEFPQVDPRVVGIRNRYVFYPAAAAAQTQRYGFQTVMRLDTESGKTDTYTFADDVSLEEHVMVPKPGSQREGEGYLVGVGFDVTRQQTFATIFDAMNLKDGPRAVIRLPYWVPICFHGNFYAT